MTKPNTTKPSQPKTQSAKRKATSPVTIALPKFEMQQVIYAVNQERLRLLKITDYAVDHGLKGTVLDHYQRSLSGWTALTDRLQDAFEESVTEDLSA